MTFALMLFQDFVSSNRRIIRITFYVKQRKNVIKLFTSQQQKSLKKKEDSKGAYRNHYGIIGQKKNGQLLGYSPGSVLKKNYQCYM